MRKSAAWQAAEKLILGDVHPEKVATIMGLSKSEVYRRAKKLGKSPSLPKRKKVADIVDGLKTGRYRTYQEAADAHGTTRQGVYYIWKKYRDE